MLLLLLLLLVFDVGENSNDAMGDHENAAIDAAFAIMDVEHNAAMAVAAAIIISRVTCYCGCYWYLTCGKIVYVYLTNHLS